jgi:hypothetical protein
MGNFFFLIKIPHYTELPGGTHPFLAKKFSPRSRGRTPRDKRSPRNTKGKNLGFVMKMSNE